MGGKMKFKDLTPVLFSNSTVSIMVKGLSSLRFDGALEDLPYGDYVMMSGLDVYKMRLWDDVLRIELMGVSGAWVFIPDDVQIRNGGVNE